MAHDNDVNIIRNQETQYYPRSIGDQTSTIHIENELEVKIVCKSEVTLSTYASTVSLNSCWIKFGL